MNEWEKHTTKSVIPISFDLHRHHLAFSLEDKKKNSFTYFTAKYFLDTLHIIAIQYLILCHYLCTLRVTVLMVIPHFKRQAIILNSQPCLSLPNAGIRGMCPDIHLSVYF